MQTQDILRAAAATVERGWTQRAMARAGDDIVSDGYDPTATAWCALGAIEHVTRTDFMFPPASDAVEALDTFISNGDSSALTVEAWNDEPGRTGAQVAMMMRFAAKRLEEASCSSPKT